MARCLVKRRENYKFTLLLPNH